MTGNILMISDGRGHRDNLYSLSQGQPQISSTDLIIQVFSDWNYPKKPTNGPAWWENRWPIKGGSMSIQDMVIIRLPRLE